MDDYNTNLASARLLVYNGGPFAGISPGYFHVRESAMQNTIDIRPLGERDLTQAKTFADTWIGKDYYTESTLKNVLKRSRKDGLSASFGAWSGDELVAIRLTYAPGSWLDDYRPKVTPCQWKVDPQKAAYFKSLFIADSFQRRGLGARLSSESLRVVTQMGSKAVLCHSWLESPGNSSQRYLKKMGFDPVKTHPRLWGADSGCTRCQPKPCECTGVEMIKHL